MKKKNPSLTYTNKSEYENKQIGYTQSQTSDWDGITSQQKAGKSWEDGEAALALYTRCLRCNTPRRICEIKKSASCTVIKKYMLTF